MTMYREPGPPFGFWSNGPYDNGAWIFFEDPPYGAYVAPTVWLPMTGGTPAHSAVWRTAFDAGWLDRVVCGTRRSVADTAVGVSVVPL